MALTGGKLLYSWPPSLFPSLLCLGLSDLQAWCWLCRASQVPIPSTTARSTRSPLYRPHPPPVRASVVVVGAERSCVQHRIGLGVLQGWPVLSVLVNPPHLHTPQTPESLYDVTRLTIEIQVLTQVFSCASRLHQNNQQRTDVTPLA